MNWIDSKVITLVVGTVICAAVQAQAADDPSLLIVRYDPEISAQRQVFGDGLRPHPLHRQNRDGLFAIDGKRGDIASLLAAYDYTDKGQGKLGVVSPTKPHYPTVGQSRTTFIPYINSRVQRSKSGRFVAVSGLSMGAPLLNYDYVKSVNPTSAMLATEYQSHYRIIVIDRFSGDHFVVFDTLNYVLNDIHKRSNIIYPNRGNPLSGEQPGEVFRSWQSYILAEMATNPRSGAQAWSEPFTWGPDATIDLQFSDSDDHLLYFRVYPTADTVGNPWLPHSVHLSFSIDFSDRSKPRLRRDIVPGSTYVTTSMVTRNATLGFGAFSIAPDLHSMIRLQFTPKELASWYQFGKQDRYLLSLFFARCGNFGDSFRMDKPICREERLTKDRALQRDYLPMVEWFDQKVAVRSGLARTEVYATNHILQESRAQLNGDLRRQLDLSYVVDIDPLFDSGATERLSFHGIPYSLFEGYGGMGSYAYANITGGGGFLLTTQSVRLQRSIVATLPSLYELESGNVRYLIYPSSPLGWYDNFKQTTLEPERFEYLVRYYNRLDWLHPNTMSQLLELSVERVTFDPRSNQLYFLETRLPALEGYDRSLLPQSLPKRREPFERIGWPTLSRIDLNHEREIDIERLGRTKEGDGSPWKAGLPLKHYPIQASFRPLEHLVDYVFD